MPRSQKNRRKSPSKRKEPKLELSSIAIQEERHDEFKKVVLTAARHSVDEFPATLGIVTNELRKSDPIGIVSTFAAYGLQTSVGREGVNTKSPLMDIQQHHAELLLALIMTIPLDEWGNDPFTPAVMETVFETVPKIAETFLHKRILAADGITDKQKLTVLSLQERIRIHTQAIRNWGYYSDVIRICTDLYGPLDDLLKPHFGFGASDLIEVIGAVVREFERRHSEHFTRLAKVIRSPNVRQMARNYYKYFPELEGGHEDLLSVIPPGVTLDSMMGVIMGHCDLRHSERASFTVAEIAKLSGKTESVVQATFKSLSVVPGSLAGINPDQLFLANPMWDAPGIELGDRFVFPIPQMVFSHIHRVMARLAREADIKKQLESRRANYLESQLETTMRKALPEATIVPAAKWQVGTEQFETDVLVTLDRTVIIAEAKSNRLTPEGLRGAPDRVKRHVSEMVLAPSEQSARLATLISSAKQGDALAEAVVRRIGINPEIVDQIIRISVTLDDFSALSSAEADFKEIGWVPVDHQLAPTITIADLICIADILENPLTYLHYLGERIYLQKSFNLYGDELDFLGLYLKTGFNIERLRQEGSIFSPSGMSEPLDRYYMSRDAGIALPKPKPQLGTLFSSIIKQLYQSKAPGWTTIGLHLLSSADPSEQKSIERNLTKLRAMVRKNFREPDHICSLQVQPPLQRKARIIFYAFPEALRAQSREVMEDLAAQAIDHDQVDHIVVFARCTDRWNLPYEAVLLLHRLQGDRASSSSA
ncbi:hypothetical protein [Pannonibacter carbonis]|uniref:hypothetical protein n=1 Tax=Pannonibacter carbonis TaxID=2067569 RepID=UPI001300ADC5|nr:hypothetical protein [Pannonibacter carbonis]